MSNKVLVHCKNTDQIIEINEGDSLLQIYGQSGVELPYQVLCARVNNKTEDLDYRVFRPKDIEFIDASHPSGMRTYVRSLCFVFYKALEDVMPGARLRIEHSISKGYFCGINNRQEISQETTNRIKARMRKIIADNLPFQRIECKTSDAIKLFQEQNLLDKVDLLETSKSLYTTFYRLDNLIDYYYSCLVPSTGYLNLFDLIKYDGGLLLVPPSAENPSVLGTVVKQDKMLAAFKEYIHFNSIIGLNNVGDLNLAIENRQATDLIKVSEALHEKKISNIADEITRRNRDGEGARIILISGPSSSGKTTFSKRLAIQLMTNLIRPVTISLDNYFVEREETPLDENGEYDYESLYALDLELFNNDINRLLKGEEIDLPTYNFETGKKIYRGNISIDDHNWIPTTDNRLLRRIIRDAKYRGSTAQSTIARWPSVRRGEEKWIFPYQENADAMFNSSLLFELAVLKRRAMPILNAVPRDCTEYGEANRLLKFLDFFLPLNEHEIPPTSLLREFLGGSSFKY